LLVKLKDIRLQRLGGFGDVWLAWGLWRPLELDLLRNRGMAAGREGIRWPQMAAILTIAGSASHSSELHIKENGIIWKSDAVGNGPPGATPARERTRSGALAGAQGDLNRGNASARALCVNSP